MEHGSHKVKKLDLHHAVFQQLGTPTIEHKWTRNSLGLKCWGLCVMMSSSAHVKILLPSTITTQFLIQCHVTELYKMTEIFLYCPIWQPQMTCGSWKDKIFTDLPINLNLNFNSLVCLMITKVGRSVPIFCYNSSTFNRTQSCLHLNFPPSDSLWSWILKSLRRVSVNFG